MNTLKMMQKDSFFKENQLVVTEGYLLDIDEKHGIIKPIHSLNTYDTCPLKWSFVIQDDLDIIYGNAVFKQFNKENYISYNKFKNNILVNIQSYFNKLEENSNKYLFPKDMLPKLFFDDKKRFEFGKHKGSLLKSFDYVNSWNYLSWCLSNIKDFVIYKDFFYYRDGYINGGSSLLEQNSEKIKNMYGYKNISVVCLERKDNKPFISKFEILEK